MKKIQTTKITGGAEYAKVSDRLKEFRADCPNSSIITTPTILDTGMVMFKAYIIKDKTDEHSADSTGHALQTKTGTKDFEKLETIAVGRALALLGYGADGEIASSEEMEEFLNYQKTKRDIEVENLKLEVDKLKTVDELRTFYQEHRGYGAELDAYITNKSKELKDANS